MNKNGNLYYLGISIIIVGFMQLLLLIFATLTQDKFFIFVFIKSALFSLFCGSLLILFTKNNSYELKRFDLIVLLIYFWIIIPIFTAIPFYYYFNSFVNSYIESISAFTTTGSSVIKNNTYIPDILFLWRNIIAWSGGLLTISIIILILTPFNIIKLQYKNLKYNKNNNFISILIVISSVYFVITAILVIALIFSGISSFNAINIIMSAISTSGYSLNEINSNYYKSIYSIIIIMLTMLVGGGLISIFLTKFINIKILLNLNIEIKIFIIICFIFSFILTIHSHFNKQLNILDFLNHYFYALFDAISILSTTGLIYNTEQQPVTLYYIIAFIGGSSFTTAGGFKLFRLIILFKHTGDEINQLIYPNSILSNRFLNIQLNTKFMRLIWSFFISYILLIVIQSMIIASYNYNLNTSLLNAIGSIANIGQLTNFMLAKGHDITPFNELETSLQLFLCIGMILGRLEILPVLGLLNLTYWKNK